MSTYAIGDIHGRVDYLRELVGLRLPLGPGDRLIFIGDYVDRGPDSSAVIDYLLGLRDRYECIFLRGNHEDMFLAWLGQPALSAPVSADSWLWAHGGGAALHSYGVPTRGLRARWKLRRGGKRHDWLPPVHLAFLRETRLTFDDEHAHYVHAGFRPGVPLEEQTADDMLTIRTGWVDEVYELDRVVVHGHTPTPFDGGELKARILPHRINIDTGCGRHPNGFLTALRLPDRALFTVGEPRRPQDAQLLIQEEWS